MWTVQEETQEPESDSDSSDSDQQAPAARRPAKAAGQAEAKATVVRTERLFSGGLDGQLTEWDPVGLAPRLASDSYGGAVWALAASPSGSHLAAACEDGTVRLFAVTADGLNYQRALPKQRGTPASLVVPARC